MLQMKWARAGDILLDRHSCGGSQARISDLVPWTPPFIRSSGTFIGPGSSIGQHESAGLMPTRFKICAMSHDFEALVETMKRGRPWLRLTRGDGSTLPAYFLQLAAGITSIGLSSDIFSSSKS